LNGRSCDGGIINKEVENVKQKRIIKPEVLTFLTVVEAKGKETKKFLEDLVVKEREEEESKPVYSLKEGTGGMMVGRSRGKTVDILPMRQYAEKLAKEIREREKNELQ